VAIEWIPFLGEYSIFDCHDIMARRIVPALVGIVSRKGAKAQRW
jgi:hypothetical protein